MKFTPNLTKTEWKNGLIAMTVAMFLLPGLLAFIPGLSEAMLNFTAYFISVGTAVYFLRRFLGKNMVVALARPFATLYLAALGYLANLAFAEVTHYIAWLVSSDYVNLNNQTVQSLLATDLPLILITTVVLAPIAEECFFRGLLFRGIYDRSPIWAWVLSVGLFAVGHVAGYIGMYTLPELLVSLLIYIPAGIILNVTYRRSGSIISPIIAHVIINLMAALAATR